MALIKNHSTIEVLKKVIYNSFVFRKQPVLKNKE